MRATKGLFVLSRVVLHWESIESAGTHVRTRTYMYVHVRGFPDSHWRLDWSSRYVRARTDSDRDSSLFRRVPTVRWMMRLISAVARAGFMSCVVCRVSCDDVSCDVSCGVCVALIGWLSDSSNFFFGSRCIRNSEHASALTYIYFMAINKYLFIYLSIDLSTNNAINRMSLSCSELSQERVFVSTTDYSTTK